jgi:hypothetical protein
MPSTQSQSSKFRESVRNYLEFRGLLREHREAVGRLEAYRRALRMQQPHLDQSLLIEDLKGLVDRVTRLNRLSERPVGGFRWWTSTRLAAAFTREP